MGVDRPERTYTFQVANLWFLKGGYIKYLEPQGQPFINRCLVISNHFLCKDWVHHPIDSQPFINGCLGFQVCLEVFQFPQKGSDPPYDENGPLDSNLQEFGR